MCEPRAASETGGVTDAYENGGTCTQPAVRRTGQTEAEAQLIGLRRSGDGEGNGTDVVFSGSRIIEDRPEAASTSSSDRA